MHLVGYTWKYVCKHYYSDSAAFYFSDCLCTSECSTNNGGYKCRSVIRRVQGMCRHSGIPLNFTVVTNIYRKRVSFILIKGRGEIQFQKTNLSFAKTTDILPSKFTTILYNPTSCTRIFQMVSTNFTLAPSTHWCQAPVRAGDWIKSKYLPLTSRAFASHFRTWSE